MKNQLLQTDFEITEHRLGFKATIEFHFCSKLTMSEVEERLKRADEAYRKELEAKL